MRPVYFSLVALFILSVVVLGLVRVLHPEWWRIRAVKRALLATPLVGLVGILAWAIPVALGSRPAAAPGAFLSALVFVTLLFLLLSLPLSGALALLVRAVAALQARFSRSSPVEASPSQGRVGRRDFLVHATAAVPAAALAAAGVGVAGAFQPPRIERVRVRVPGLHPDVHGLKILQLTDIHIGTFIHLGDLERTLEACEAVRPDLVLITGDACDHLPSLPAAVRLIRGLRPPLGTIASLGNHEYYRGAEAFRRAYDRADVPLLVDESLRLPVGGGSILVAGADDPAIMGREMQPFLERSISRAVRDRHEGEPVVLLSHRPDGFDAAARHGVTLTLAGHTHGGQVGHRDGRSVFEPLFPHWYLRGRYERDGSTLFTSSGFGHWLPFRLDCPAEVPLVILEGGVVHSARNGRQRLA